MNPVCSIMQHTGLAGVVPILVAALSASGRAAWRANSTEADLPEGLPAV